MNQQNKKDAGKPRFDLIPPEWCLHIAKVLTFGIEKGYKEDSWRSVEQKRYIAAALRHFNAYQSGEINDPESGLPHLAHVLCNIGFLLSIDQKVKVIDTQKMEENCMHYLTRNY